jgi:hypothetical protein
MIKRMIKPCDAASSPPDLGDHCGAGTRYSIWWQLADWHAELPRSRVARSGYKAAAHRPRRAGGCALCTHVGWVVQPVQRGLQRSVGGGCGSAEHWLLASFALHRWLDNPRMVKTADDRARWHVQALC